VKRRSEPTSLHIRWMIRRDMPEVHEIENASFQFPWDEDAFIRCLRQRNCIGMVVERAEKIVGYMIYELHKNRLHILNLGVHPQHRRQGVGRALLDKLKGKLSPQRRSRIMCEVRETNLDAQMWLRACGFKAISVLKDFYEDVAEDAYLMQHRHVEEKQACAS
jgi:ribosomal-protein-alanine N-acetyltransferase